MTVWIEQSQENGHSLTWDGVVSLVKEAHHNGDPNVTPMVLDLVYGLRDTKVRISLLIITHKFNINSQIDANNLDIFLKNYRSNTTKLCTTMTLNFV